MRRFAWLIPVPVGVICLTLLGKNITASWQDVVAAFVLIEMGAFSVLIAKWTKEA